MKEETKAVRKEKHEIPTGGGKDHAQGDVLEWGKSVTICEVLVPVVSSRRRLPCSPHTSHEIDDTDRITCTTNSIMWLLLGRQSVALEARATPTESTDWLQTRCGQKSTEVVGCGYRRIL